MNQSIEVIYENGVLRPLQPLDLPENKILTIDVHDVEENGAETMREKASRVLRDAGLISSLKFPGAKKLSDKERRRLGKLFSGEKPLSGYINEDREARG